MLIERISEPEFARGRRRGGAVFPCAESVSYTGIGPQGVFHTGLFSQCVFFTCAPGLMPLEVRSLSIVMETWC